MKIISSKKFEEMNQTLVDLQMELNDKVLENATLEEQVAYLQKEIAKALKHTSELTTIISSDTRIIEEKTITIKKLKTLLTKNKIDYKSALEKGDKNVTKTTNKTRKTTRKTK